MPDQIQIRWSSYSGADYEESLKALREFEPEPNVKTKLGINGNMPKKAIDDIRKIVNRYQDVTMDVLATATWGKNESPDQLRLFGPPQLDRLSHSEAPDNPGEEAPDNPSEATDALNPETPPPATNEEPAQADDDPPPPAVTNSNGRGRPRNQPVTADDPKPDPQPDPVPAGASC